MFIFYVPAILATSIDYLQNDFIGQWIGIGDIPAMVDLITIRFTHFWHLVLAYETQFIGAGTSRPTIFQARIVDSAIIIQWLAVGDKLHIAKIVA